MKARKYISESLSDSRRSDLNPHMFRILEHSKSATRATRQHTSIKFRGIRRDLSRFPTTSKSFPGPSMLRSPWLLEEQSTRCEAPESIFRKTNRPSVREISEKEDPQRFRKKKRKTPSINCLIDKETEIRISLPQRFTTD